MADSCVIEVRAGEHKRDMCPVSILLPWSYKDFPGAAAKWAESGKGVSCQVDSAGGAARLTFVVHGLKAGDAQELKVTALPAAEEGVPAVRVDDKPDAGLAEVHIGGKLFTAYNYGEQWVRPFLYPVLGPGNRQVTRNWPIVEDVSGEETDHPHHKSIWVAHGDCNGVDNWSEQEGHGWQVHKRFLKRMSGNVYGEITARIDWCGATKRRQFQETRQMRFYSVPGGGRLFDISVTFQMSDGRVVFRDTKEGGLVSVRVASSMDARRGGCIENAYGGINEGETWGRKSPWCDYHGEVDGKHAGVAIMDHETNPRYPTEWHVRNYGLMTANCFGWSYYRPEDRQKGDMVFPKGSRTTWQYRLYLHKGDTKKGRVRNRFIDYISPPQVSVK